MASRNFWYVNSKSNCVNKCIIEFKWEPGLSISQKRRSCNNLMCKLNYVGNFSPLDISSASTEKLGVALSAFNLMWRGKPLECWYQGSKIYSIAGAMHKLYNATSMEAKQSMKASNLGKLIGFNLEGVEYPTEPRTAFYDWIYLYAMLENYGQGLDLSQYDTFTDVQATLDVDACQARTVAEYRLMQLTNAFDCLSSFDSFVAWYKEHVDIPLTYNALRSGDYTVEDNGNTFMCCHMNDNYYTSFNLLGKKLVHRKYSIYDIVDDPSHITSDYCVVYTDLLLDDLCAIQLLSYRYRKVCIIAVNHNDLPTSDYAYDGCNIFTVISKLKEWFDDVVVRIDALSCSNVTVANNEADCYSLANATAIVKDLEAGFKYKSITAMIGSSEEEWNASQDVEAYHKLLTYGIKQVSFEDCEKLYAEKGYHGFDKYIEYLPTYISKMNAINDSICCFDFQAVASKFM